MWLISHASFWKFSKLSNSRIPSNWSITDGLTSRNTIAYFLTHSVVPLLDVKRFCDGATCEMKFVQNLLVVDYRRKTRKRFLFRT